LTSGYACTNKNNRYSQVKTKDWQVPGAGTFDGHRRRDGCLHEVDHDHDRRLAYDDQQLSWHPRYGAVTGIDNTGSVTITATGDVLLGGFNSSVNSGADANGEARIVPIASGSAGSGLLTLTPAVKTNAWATGYAPPTDAPAPVSSATAEVVIGQAVTKSISIVGSRTTVRRKPGISIVGVTQGFEDGKTVLPYFRFPGETTYTQGSARPEITDGEFVWQRKTGKKFYAYVTNDDGSVKSNRVIIPAK